MIAALVLSALMQLEPPSSADANLLAHNPKMAATYAVGTFMFGCAVRASDAVSAAQYAQGTDELARYVAARSPDFSAVPVTLSSANGDSCKVTYHGVEAEPLWLAFSDFSKNRMNGVCDDVKPTATRAVVTCEANKGNPAYTQTAERHGDVVSVTYTWRGPKTP